MRRIIKVVGQPQLGTLFAAWSPLKQPLFRAVWIAALVSNVGTLMQSTGGAWLITSLTDSPLLIALMTTATSLPLVLLCLPGGALADIGDKKRLLIISHLWMFGAAMILGILSFTNNITSLSLLLLTFVMGVGNAITFPAWMATLSEIVDKKYLSKALTLNSLSYNISLIIGPLLAALFLAQFSVGWIFIVNALSFVAILGVIRRGKDEVIDTNLPKEELMSALRISFRYTKHHPQLRSLLYRTALVIFFGSAFWGLFPSVARFTLIFHTHGILLIKRQWQINLCSSRVNSQSKTAQ